MQHRHNKIIFAGPVGAGKTTAIAALSDVPVVSTEATATDTTREIKPTTTVAMDYGVLKLHNDVQIHLYGTPGQRRFDFMWEILTEGGIGLVLLINNSAPDPIDELRQFLGHFADFIGKTGVVIGITQTDLCPLPSVEEYHRRLAGAYPASLLGSSPAIFAVDARERRDVRTLVEALLYSLDPDLVT